MITSPKHSKIIRFNQILTLLVLFSLLIGMTATSGQAQEPATPVQDGPVLDPEEPRQSEGHHSTGGHHPD